MRWRGTLALLIALVVAALWLYRDVTGGRSDVSWRAIFAEPEPPPPGAEYKRLLEFDPAQVTAVTLHHGERTLHTERTADGWSGTANGAAIDEFLRALTQLALIMPIEVDPARLADHGLAPAQATVELTRRDGAPIVLLVGGRNPPATAVYAQVGVGGPVALTGALLSWDLDKAERALAAPPG
ncbi:MAG: hypothetical protein SF182_08565 [Deltaproteobacteria bacterium]|nr:hypothetical protein [Deltaproteobacteria bacterium]